MRIIDEDENEYKKIWREMKEILKKFITLNDEQIRIHKDDETSYWFLRVDMKFLRSFCFLCINWRGV